MNKYLNSLLVVALLNLSLSCGDKIQTPDGSQTKQAQAMALPLFAFGPIGWIAGGAVIIIATVVTVKGVEYAIYQYDAAKVKPGTSLKGGFASKDQAINELAKIEVLPDPVQTPMPPLVAGQEGSAPINTVLDVAQPKPVPVPTPYPNHEVVRAEVAIAAKAVPGSSATVFDNAHGRLKCWPKDGAADQCYCEWMDYGQHFINWKPYAKGSCLKTDFFRMNPYNKLPCKC